MYLKELPNDMVISSFKNCATEDHEISCSKPGKPCFAGYSVSFNKSEKGKSMVNSGYSTLASSAMVCNIITNVNKGSIASTSSVQRFLKNPLGQIHPLVTNKYLQLGAWMVSGNIGQQKEHQSRLQTLYQTVGEQEQHHMLNYLADLFFETMYLGLLIYTGRQFLPTMITDGFKVRKHPNVCGILTGF